MYDIAKFQKIALIVALLGVLLFAGGWATNHISKEEIEKEYAIQKEKFDGVVPPMHSSHLQTAHDDESAHIEQAEHQVGNKPWASLLMVAMLFFGLSAATLFFYSIQHAANAGWSIVVLRVMQSIASFIPIAGIILLVISLASAFHLGHNHLYHWMQDGLGDAYMKVVDGKEQFFKTQVEGSVPNPHYDFMTDAKSPFLNIPFWILRLFIYVGGCTFFFYKLKNVAKRLDEEKTVAAQHRMYNWSVGYIAFFALASAAWAWDWLMSIDHHWYSTLYIWYTMVSCLVTGVAFTLIFSIYMKDIGKLPFFNDNHQHDLTKYLFGFSLLWGYLWFDQFMLYWYGDIPEDVNYFLGRYKLYPNSYFWMLIPNLVLPLVVLVSSSIKRNAKVVMFMCFVIILGHLWDFYNIVMPGTVGGFHNLGLLVIGATLMIMGIFFYWVLRTLNNTDMVPEGNQYLQESKTFEYPF